MRDLFGSEPRIYSDGGGRDNPKHPYIVWQVITETPSKTIGFKTGSESFRVQFDIYADHSQLAKKIGIELERVFLGRGIPLLRMGPAPEQGTKLYRRTIDMSFFKKGNKDE